MKINFEKSDLLRGINIVIRAISGKSTMPILECIAITATDTSLKFTSNNLEIGIESTIQGTVIENGRIAVNARILSEIIRKLPGNTISIESDSNYNVVFQSENADFTITGLPVNDFPFLPTIDSQQFITISQASFRDVIKQTVFSVSDNEGMNVLTGEHLEVDQNRLRLSSLDGLRLSIREIKLSKNYTPFDVIIPGRTLNEISKILSDNPDDEMQIFFTSNHIMFQFSDSILVSRLIEGTFYPVDKMISADYITKLKIKRLTLLECMDRSTLLVNEADKQPIVLTISDHNMNIKLQSGIGRLNENIGIQKEGADLKIAFNPTYLIDCLRNITDDHISIYFSGNKMPCSIKDDEGTYLYVISPIAYKE